MTELQATTVGGAICGDAWYSGGGIWLVVRKRSDGRMVVMSDECVCEYRNHDAADR